MTSSNEIIFHITGPLCREFTGHRSMFSLMFSLICAWINGRINNHEPGDLMRHCAHYDVTVMTCIILGISYMSWLHMTAVVICMYHDMIAPLGLIPGLCPANERWRCFVTAALIGWAQTLNPPCAPTTDMNYTGITHLDYPLSDNLSNHIIDNLFSDYFCDTKMDITSASVECTLFWFD